MDPKLRNLAWLELRERRTQFVVCLLWMIGATTYSMVYAVTSGTVSTVASFHQSAMTYGLLLPIFLAMRTSLGEMTERTRSFADGLPISPRLRAGTRLAGGAAVLVVPILAAALWVSAWHAAGWIQLATNRTAGRDASEQLLALGSIWCVVMVAGITASCLYLLLCLLGTMLQAELHLGYCGAAIACLWLLGIEQPLGAHWVGCLLPQSIGVADCNEVFLKPGRVLLPLAVNAVLQIGLAAWFVRRYGRQLRGRVVERSGSKPKRIWWRPRLPSRPVALAWMAVRQSVPLCLPGLALACLLTLFQMDMQSVSQQEARDDAEQQAAIESALGEPGRVLMTRLEVELPAELPVAIEETPAEQRIVHAAPARPHRFKYVWQCYKDSLPSATWVIGGLWAVVVGAGLFSSELDWRVGEFWRTRPISAWSVFAIKFIVGLLAVLLVLDGTAIAAGWKSPRWGEYNAMNRAYFACILPLHATLFAVAVAWTCVLRRAALGAMAALLTYIGIGLVLDWFTATRGFEPIQIYNTWGFADRGPAGGPERYPLVAAAMALITVASILTGWLALRHYDPRRMAN